jgi:general secretion pathway protein H
MVQTESPGPKTTLRWNNGRTKKFSRGFTLIEIMVVLAIISMVIALGLPAINRVTYQRLNSTTRQFTGLIRTIRNDAILLNNIYRLAIDLDQKTYWVEMQRELKMLNETPEDQVQSRKSKKSDPPPSNFILATKFTKKPVLMPSGIVFDGVLKEREGLITQGVAYIHFFPNGFNDQAVLYLNKEGASSFGYSLVIRPTLGRVELYREQISTFDFAAK